MRVHPGDPSVSPPLDPSVASPARPAAVPRSSEGASFASLLHGLGRAIDDGEANTRAVLGGLRGAGDLGPGQLLALQAGVYRYSEAIDLASRLVDRAGNAVKTVVQGSGQ